jgi:hypothetical protein
MNTTSALLYANEFVAVSEGQVAHWEVHPGERFPSAVSGKCPVCGHDCHIEIRGEFVWGARTSAAPTSSPPALTRLFVCNCLNDHSQPDGVEAGCGRYWLGTLTRRQDGTYDLAPEQDLGIVRAAAALNEVVANQDKAVQSAAEKWLGGVSAVYGLFSIAGLAVGRNVVSNLTTGGKVAVAVVVLVGLTAAAVAAIFGYLAAYGWPRRARVMSKNELAEWYQQTRDYAPTAAERLKVAVLAALASLSALVAAMFMTWFLPISK